MELTEKARDAKLELTAGLKNWWAEEDLSCLVGWWLSVTDWQTDNSERTERWLHSFSSVWREMSLWLSDAICMYWVMLLSHQCRAQDRIGNAVWRYLLIKLTQTYEIRTQYHLAYVRPLCTLWYSVSTGFVNINIQPNKIKRSIIWTKTEH